MAPSAIRYYERVGVLPKPDRLGGHRRYTPETVRRLQVIDLAAMQGSANGEDGSPTDDPCARFAESLELIRDPSAS